MGGGGGAEAIWEGYETKLSVLGGLIHFVGKGGGALNQIHHIEV
jgi:hypothetical protein